MVNRDRTNKPNKKNKQMSTQTKKATATATLPANEITFVPSIETPKDETTGNVLKLAKAAKAIPAHRAKLALIFQALKAAKDGKKEIIGLSVDMWTSRPNGADFDGMTIRFTGDLGKGADKAILSTIHTALKGAGVEMTCFVLRKGGSASLFI